MRASTRAEPCQLTERGSKPRTRDYWRYGTRIRISAQTSPLLCTGFRFYSRSTSCFRFSLNGATCGWNKYLLSCPPFLFTATVITEHTVVLLQRVNIQSVERFLSLPRLKCRFERRDVKVAGDIVGRGASLSLSVGSMTLVFSSTCFCLHGC